MAHFQNGVSISGEIFFRTRCQFGVPGGTYPPKKYPSAPRRFYARRRFLSAHIPHLLNAIFINIGNTLH